MGSKPQSLVQLAEKFDIKLTLMRESFDLVQARKEPAVIDLTKSVNTTLQELETILIVMRAELKRRRKALECVEEMKKATAYQQESIRHMAQNLPTHLPQQQQQVRDDQPHKQTSLRPPSVQTPSRGEQRYQETPLSVHPSNTPVPSAELLKQRSMGLFLPAIDYLRLEEFTAIPKYMKGRHPYDHVNHTIDELNKALKAKYTVLNTPRSRQNEPIKRQIRAYKEQESKDTKGQYFVVDKDIKDHSTLKLDSVGRAMLTMLRHCKRIKEVRGKGLTRYMVLQQDSLN